MSEQEKQQRKLEKDYSQDEQMLDDIGTNTLDSKEIHKGSSVSFETFETPMKPGIPNNGHLPNTALFQPSVDAQQEQDPKLVKELMPFAYQHDLTNEVNDQTQGDFVSPVSVHEQEFSTEEGNDQTHQKDYQLDLEEPLNVSVQENVNDQNDPGSKLDCKEPNAPVQEQAFYTEKVTDHTMKTRTMEEKTILKKKKKRKTTLKAKSTRSLKKQKPSPKERVGKDEVFIFFIFVLHLLYLVCIFFILVLHLSDFLCR